MYTCTFKILHMAHLLSPTTNILAIHILVRIIALLLCSVCLARMRAAALVHRSLNFSGEWFTCRSSSSPDRESVTWTVYLSLNIFDNRITYTKTSKSTNGQDRRAHSGSLAGTLSLSRPHALCA